MLTIHWEWLIVGFTTWVEMNTSAKTSDFWRLVAMTHVFRGNKATQPMSMWYLKAHFQKEIRSTYKYKNTITVYVHTHLYIRMYMYIYIYMLFVYSAIEGLPYSKRFWWICGLDNLIQTTEARTHSLVTSELPMSPDSQRRGITQTNANTQTPT